jgi:hypothetical protein
MTLKYLIIKLTLTAGMTLAASHIDGVGSEVRSTVDTCSKTAAAQQTSFIPSSTADLANNRRKETAISSKKQQKPPLNTIENYNNATDIMMIMMTQHGLINTFIFIVLSKTEIIQSKYHTPLL